MKKFLVVLLSLGLIVAFGATASAADVKFSGSYYVVGWYADNQGQVDYPGGTSHAGFWQRFRVMPVFQVAEGLTLTGRFDAMEKGWGNTNWKGGADDMNQSRKETQSFGNPNVQENFEWERGFMTFRTAIGQFDIGYQQSGKWGTDFLDDEKSRPRIKLTTKAGPVTMLFVYEKQFESVYSAQPGFAATTDTDNENYAVGAIFSFKQGNAGLLYKFTDNRYNRLNSNFASKLHYLAPYMKATFGPVYVEAELDYMFGKAKRMDPAHAVDMDCESYAGYVKVRADMGPAYFGGYLMYTPGQPYGADKKKDWTNASGNGSQDLDAGILLGNDWLQTWRAGANGTGGNFSYDSAKYNSVIFGGFAGFKPTPKLALEAMLLYAQRDKIEEAAQVNQNDSKKLGTEFDITASYKIYDNLTYMVGFAYLWTGDAFKGYAANSSDNKVANDYLLLNKISLSF